MLAVQFSVFLKKNHISDFCLISGTFPEDIKLVDSCEKCGVVFCDCFKELNDIDIKKYGKPVHKLKTAMDGYLCSLFYYILQISVPYRTCFINYISKRCKKLTECVHNSNFITVRINLNPVEQEVLDYKGNEMFEISCLERRELDNAMAWLSTLGGAFSALGDTIESCAAIAGKISVRQLEIALRLGDPFLIARCKLYMALSLIQRHKFKQAKELIKAQYIVATQGPIKDNKLRSMCLGIWAKLKYDRSRLKQIQKNSK